MTPSVSIVIPAYNVAPYIGQTLQSVLDQDYDDYEIIVVEDCSTDDTLAVIDQWQAHIGDRLRLVRHSQNSGLGAARNTGIDAARGALIALLDSDDLWTPHSLAKRVAFLNERSSLDMVFSWARIIDEQGNPTGTYYRPTRDVDFRDLVLGGNCIGSGSVIMRQRLLAKVGRFDATVRSCEDVDMWLRIAAQKDANIGCVHEVLAEYRDRPGQLTKDWRTMRDTWEHVITKARAVRPHLLQEIETMARARYCRYWAYLAYESGDYESARRLLLEAWRHPGALLGERRTWLTSFAVVSTLLPTPFHSHLATIARRLVRWRENRRIGDA